MDRRSRAQQWRRARHNYNDLCPPIGRRAATALLWLSCSIALLRAFATSTARAQQRAAQQRRSFLNAHHRSSAQVVPQPPESDQELEHEHEESEPEPEPEPSPSPSLAGCLNFQQEFYDSETDSETDSEIESQTETETAPTTEPETEPEDERGPPIPVVSGGPSFSQSLTERLNALRLNTPDASPRRVQPNTQEPQNPSQGEEPQPKDQESTKPKKQEKKKRRLFFRCKPKKNTRRDPSPEGPPKRGPIPIRRV